MNHGLVAGPPSMRVYRWMGQPGAAAAQMFPQPVLPRHAPQVLDRDWRGDAAPTPVRTLLVLDDTHLHVGAWVAGSARVYGEAVPGRFRAGLWQRDVVELFLSDLEGDGYREYHLSPGGEWWMGCFSGPRVEAAAWSASPPEAKLRIERDSSGWSGLLSLPAPLLPPGFLEAVRRGRPVDGARTGSPLLRGNLTAIVGDPTSWLSLVPLPGDRPDFHQPSRFPVIEVHES